MKGAGIADKISNLINERARLQAWSGLEQPDFEAAEKAIVELLSVDEEETVAYIETWCLGIDLEFIIEVAEQINSRLHSQRFLNALRAAAEKNYKAQLEDIKIAEEDSVAE
ncbi:MAG: hypothetical protein Q4A96_01210 [Candidatus Saccharibacteria bacterium]|nr:hypothetical protein [Candidatus Saccharibacteria bacterium]